MNETIRTLKDRLDIIRKKRPSERCPSQIKLAKLLIEIEEREEREEREAEE